MENNLNEDILDKLTKTCTCKLITRAKIKEAIKNGASTLEESSKRMGRVVVLAREKLLS